jgi:prepilin peptidase CpaA
MALALTSFHVALIVIAASLFVAAAISDATSYRIPNYLCGLLILLFPVFVMTAPRSIDWHQNLMVFGLVALSGFAMFLGNMAGAGDIKLLSAASLWAGPHFIAVLLVVTAIAGGIESLIIAAITYRKHRNEPEKSGASQAASLAKVSIPYGIAIATGGLAMLAMIAQPILLPD